MERRWQAPRRRSAVGQAHALQHPGVVARGLQPLDVDGLILHAELCGCGLYPLGKHRAQAAPGRDVSQQFGNTVHIAVLYCIAALALLICLDRQADQVSAADGVHAQAVAHIVEIGDLLNAVHLAEPAEREYGLILGALNAEALVAALLDGGQAAAGDKALEAGMGPHVATLVAGRRR